MRIVNGIFFVFLVLSVAVQYNDPDPLVWGAVYGVAAVWCGLAAFRPEFFETAFARLLVSLTFLASLVGVWWWWPTTPRWWMQEVWWATETAREGMGAMIVAVALLAATALALRVGRA